MSCRGKGGTERQEALFFQGSKQHRLFIKTQLTDLVEEKQSVVGSSKQTRTIFECARKGTFDVAEQCRHCGVPAQSRAIDFYGRTRDLMSRFLELVDAPCQLRFARPGRTGE